MESFYPVVVSGGGPVGLSAALNLAKLGVKTLVIDRSNKVTDHPKARGVNCRSMELFRQWGVEDALRVHSFPDSAGRFTWMTDFQGEVITHVKGDRSVYEKVSPTRRGLISQERIEEVLWTKLAAEPLVTSLRGHRVKFLGQDESRVQIEVEGKFPIDASYLIAAEGSHSAVRVHLGIGMQGSKIGEHCSIFFRGDLLGKYLKDGPSVGFFSIANRGLGKVLLSGNAKDLWVFIFGLDGKEIRKEDCSPEMCLKQIRNAFGVEDLEIEIKSINFWTMATLTADNFHRGRVFLVGDAAHSVPPTGGFGMNLGIQDAHNLAWKLAYVLKGYASPELLSSYEEERKPLVQKISAWSVPNNTRLRNIYAAASAKDFPRMQELLEEQAEHLNSSGLDLGFHYTSTAVADSSESVPDMVFNTYIPTSFPGFRAPHVWLQRNGEKSSTLDLFFDAFVLLTGDSSEAWRKIQEKICKETHLPVKFWKIGPQGDFQDLGNFLSIYTLSPEGAVLVRPDGHIACRWKSPEEFLTHPLHDALAKIMN